jgi:integrase
MHQSGSMLERRKYLTREEFSRLLKMSKEEPRAWILFFTIANLGLRVGEAALLLAQDVSSTEDVVSVHVEKQADRKAVKVQVHDVKALYALTKSGIRADGDYRVKLVIEFSGGLTTEVRWARFADVAKITKLGDDKEVKRTDPVVRMKVPRSEGFPQYTSEVPHEVVLELRKWIRNNKLKKEDRLFPWSKRQSQYYWTTYSKKAGVEVKASDVGEGRKGRGIHCLRHLRGLLGTDAGGTLLQVRQLLRQKSESSAAVYAHTSKMKDLVRKIGVVK